MRLFLLRHAQARDTWPDDERDLTPKGEEQIKKLCKHLDPSNFANVVQIWHSPYLRAEKTATMFKSGMKIDADMVRTDNLTPEDNPNETARMIAAVSCFGGDLLIVSHNPLLENLSDILMSGDKRGGRAAFRKCALAALSLYEEPSPSSEYGVWTLDFLLTPHILP